MECPEVIRITDWQEQQDGYSHRMKRLFQIVAFVVIALLAVPPSLAESLCITASEKRANMECCDVDHVSSVSPLPDVIQNCDEGCCSIAPQKAPAATVPDRFKADATGLDMREAVASSFTVLLPDVAAFGTASNERALDLPVLLQTFRI